jgi:hypothetical protein
MKLTSMKLTKAEKKDRGGAPVAATASGDGPDYPWGLTLYLEANALDKLGVKTLPEVGVECELRGVGKVVRVGESSSENDKTRTVEVQITKLALEHDDQSFGKGFAKGPKRAY